jgi:mannosyltransferase
VRGPTAENGSDFRSAASIIRERKQPGDGIVYTALPHLGALATTTCLRGDHRWPRDLLLRRSPAAAGTLVAVEIPGFSSSLAGAGRVWLLAAGQHADPLTARTDLRALLTSRYVEIARWPIHRAALALYAQRAR